MEEMQKKESEAGAFVFETRIRFIDTDASGRIHYTCLFRYFEAAEIEFFRTMGFRTFREDVSFPRVHVECDYRLALLYDDLIQIEVRLTKVGGSSVRLEFRVMKQGKLAATGCVVMVCMDRKTLGAVAIPEELRGKLLARVADV
jgi:YbgC/YbaW family acyl-CoA thioester hydrolase